VELALVGVRAARDASLPNATAEHLPCVELLHVGACSRDACADRDAQQALSAYDSLFGVTAGAHAMLAACAAQLPPTLPLLLVGTTAARLQESSAGGNPADAEEGARDVDAAGAAAAHGRGASNLVGITLRDEVRPLERFLSPFASLSFRVLQASALRPVLTDCFPNPRRRPLPIAPRRSSPTPPALWLASRPVAEWSVH
jgi:hypothetical protein